MSAGNGAEQIRDRDQSILMQTANEYWQCFATNGRTRRHTRQRVRVSVTVMTDSNETLRGLSNDLSEAGMGFYLSHRFEVGQTIRVEVCPPGSQEIRTAAIVRNCDGFRCGIEFNGS